MNELQNRIDDLKKNGLKMSSDELEFWASQEPLLHAKKVDPFVNEMNMVLFKMSTNRPFDIWLKDVWRNQYDYHYIKKIEVLSNIDNNGLASKRTYLRTYYFEDYGVLEDVARSILQKKLEAMNHRCHGCAHCLWKSDDTFAQDDKIGVCKKKNAWIRLSSAKYPCYDSYLPKKGNKNG